MKKVDAAECDDGTPFATEALNVQTRPVWCHWTPEKLTVRDFIKVRDPDRCRSRSCRQSHLQVAVAAAGATPALVQVAPGRAVEEVTVVVAAAVLVQDVPHLGLEERHVHVDRHHLRETNLSWAHPDDYCESVVWDHSNNFHLSIYLKLIDWRSLLMIVTSPPVFWTEAAVNITAVLVSQRWLYKV